MKRNLSIGGAALGVCALVAGVAWQAQSEDAPKTPATAQPAPSPLTTGTVAPEFTLRDQNDKAHSLADYKGKTVVLAFYPADMTAGCTLEARGLTQALPEFQKRNAQLFGVSVQDVASKKMFCDKEGIGYSLLADAGKSTSKNYGVLNSRGLSNRVTFIVAPDGTIADVDTTVNVNTHAADILKRLDTLKLNAEANTSPNQKVAIDAPVTAFTLPDAKGQNTTIGNWNAENTKATVLLWVSVQCPVSNAYNTRMAQIANEYKAKGVRVFGINSNRAEAPAQIAQHATENNLGFPILKDANNVIADRFTAQVTPEAYIIDDKGVLRYHGRIDDSQNVADIKSRDLNAALDAVLAGQGVPNKKTRAFGCAIKRVNG